MLYNHGPQRHTQLATAAGAKNSLLTLGHCTSIGLDFDYCRRSWQAKHDLTIGGQRMNLNTDRVAGALVAIPGGRIDGLNARDFQEALKAAANEQDTAVIVDFGSVTYISSAGLRAVLVVAKLMRERKASFSLCALSEPIREIFSVSGFDKIIDIHATREDAVADAT